MANDLTLSIRRACLAALKSDAPLTSLVPAGSIWPQTTPANVAWPFVKMGAPTALPVRAGCVDGHSGIFAVHGFAKVRTDTGQVVETAEDHAARIGSAIAAALDRQNLGLDGGQSVRVMWTGSQLMQDGDEADAFHTVQNFRVRALA